MSGSVLAQGDSIYFAAGKSAFLDDGIYPYRLHPVTGKEQSETRIYLLDADGRQPQVDWLAMPGALPDVLSSDGQYVYMRHLAFGMDGARVNRPGNDHLYCLTGFLDRSGFHRSYWNYGKGSFVSRVGIGTGGGSGSMLIVMGKDQLFRFGRARAVNAMMRRDEPFFLSCSPRWRAAAASTSTRRRRGRAEERTTGKEGKSTPGPGSEHWARVSPIQVRATVLCQETLFIAGPKGDGIHSADAYQGPDGVALLAVSASTGTAIAEYSLPELPVFDGMSAACKRLYLSLSNGNIMCFRGR